MSSRFLAPDLSKLPAPNVIEEISHSTILQSRLKSLSDNWAEELGEAPQWDVGTLETDPLKTDQRVDATFEVLMRSRVNDAAKAVLITHAMGADLDAIGARFGTVRFDGESDQSYRRRIQLALEAFSSAGPEGAYRYHALAAHPKVKGVGLSVPLPGSVLVAVLSHDGNGAASSEIVSAVRERLLRDDIRPLTVGITVKSARVTPYQINAHLRIPAGPDPEALKVAAENALAALAQERHVVGGSVDLSAIIAAAHVSNVKSVSILSPNGDLLTDVDEVRWCEAITVTYEVIE